MSQQAQSFRTIGNVSTNSAANDGSLNLTNTKNNAVVGTGASTKNLTGRDNTVVGTNALFQSTGGDGIVAVGFLAAQNMNSAAGAVMIGDRVAARLASGSDSIVVGFAGGANVTAASGSVIIGPNAGTTADNRSCIYDGVGIGSHTLVVGTGPTCVGAGSLASGDASICIGFCNVHIAAGGVTVGSYCSNTCANSILIGQGLPSGNNNTSPCDNLIIVAGGGLGHLNVQNVLTGSVDTSTGLYDLSLSTSAGTLSLGSSHGTLVTGGLASDSIVSPLLTVRSASAKSSWNVALAPDSECSWADLMLSSSHGTQVTFCDDFVTGVLNFTAQHRCILSHDGNTLAPGSVVVATGTYSGLDGSPLPKIDEAVPVVAPSTFAHDTRVFGVVSRPEELTSVAAQAHMSSHRRTFRVGSIGFSVPRLQGETMTRVVVNSGGEGGILVCDANGPIENGDLLVSSPFMGLAMRQGDDTVRASTVAKATCACDFADDANIASSLMVREALIGCVYMC